MADCFLKLDQVTGESHDQEFDGYIQVSSWQWGVSQRAALQGSIGGKSGVGEVQMLTFSHSLDSASAGLMSRCVKNTVIPKGDLVMRRAGGKAQRYLIIKLEKVRVLAVELVHDKEHEMPSERVVLNFDRVEMEYTPQSAAGSDKSGASSFQWLRVNPDS